MVQEKSPLHCDAAGRQLSRLRVEPFGPLLWFWALPRGLRAIVQLEGPLQLATFVRAGSRRAFEDLAALTAMEAGLLTLPMRL
jgi:hypothetical protein